jgi:hypothetical protein
MLIYLRPTQVKVPFNFERAANHKAQLSPNSLAAMTWDDDIPRKLVSEDGYVMVATMPKLTGRRGTVSSLVSR